MDVPDDLWRIARERERVIRSLVLQPLAYGARGEQLAAAAQALNVSQPYLYRLIRAYQADPRTQSLLGRRPGRKVGVRRLDERVETIIEEEIRTNYLGLLKPRKSALLKGIHARCKTEKLPKPARETVDLRLAAISKREQTKRRHGAKRAHDEFDPIWGSLEADRPLQIVQIDHTPADVVMSRAAATVSASVLRCSSSWATRDRRSVTRGPNSARSTRPSA